MGAVLAGGGGVPVLDPAWAPTQEQVAALVPNRTVTQGGSTPAINGVFTADTIPTTDQVDLLIEQAVAWVTTRTGTIATALYDMATACAAMRTAGLVQTAYPVSDASYSYNGGQSTGDDVGARWFAQAEAALKSLVAANVVAGGGTETPDGATFVAVGQWSFPDPPAYGDALL